MSMPVTFQRLEGALVFTGSILFFHAMHGNWFIFPFILIAIDFSMVGYLLDKRTGALVYNLGHTFIMPFLLSALAIATGSVDLMICTIPWFAHIGLDRALGYGLKFPTGFKHTHLGDIGH